MNKSIQSRTLTALCAIAALLCLATMTLFLRRGKEPESLPPIMMSSPSRTIVKSITGNGVPESLSVAGEATGAVAAVCGNGANADRYEARNDALRSIARRRDLPKEDVAAMIDYLASTNDPLRAERVAALKNDVMNLLRNQEPPVESLAETLIAMFDCGAHPRASAATARRCRFCARRFPLPAATPFSTSSPSAPSGFSATLQTFRGYHIS